jgi:hypothetical protein
VSIFWRSKSKYINKINIKMGPKKDPPKNNPGTNPKIQDYLDDAQPPIWAKKMEDRIVQSLREVSDSVASQSERLDDIEKRVDKRFQRLEERLENHEFHQRKYNLLFYGLKLEPAVDCEVQVRKFMERDLEMGNTTAIPFANIHPLPPTAGGSACIVRFVAYKDKERILKSLGKLKGKNCGVTVRTDLPPIMRSKRKELLQRMRELKTEDRSRTLRVAERGQELFLEEKSGPGGKWKKM